MNTEEIKRAENRLKELLVKLEKPCYAPTIKYVNKRPLSYGPGGFFKSLKDLFSPMTFDPFGHEDDDFFQ